MSFNFSFRSIEDDVDLANLRDFLLSQALGYKGYEDWVERSMHELGQGYKTSVLAFSDRKLVADMIWQPHKTFPRVREIKNIRVHPNVRERYFAKFMLRQAETENPHEFDAIIADARPNHPVKSLLVTSGYEELGRAHLYDQNNPDIIYFKRFERTPEGLLAPVKRLVA